MSDFNNNPYAADSFTGADNFGGTGGDDFYAPAPMVPDYLIPSILATIFCCTPLGIVAIVFSAMASSEKGAGNYQKALAHAKTARIFLIISVVCGIFEAMCMLSFILLPVLLQAM